MVIFVISRNVKIDRAIYFIGKAICDEFLDNFYLFNDMAGRRWFDVRRQNVKLAHHLVEAFGIVLHDLHRFELLEPVLSWQSYLRLRRHRFPGGLHL